MIRAYAFALIVTAALAVPSTLAQTSDSAWQKYQSAAVASFRQGRYTTAEHMYKLAIDEAERARGGGVDLSASLNGLGAVLCQKGDVQAAQPVYQRSLSVLEKAVGADNPKVIGTMLDLASVYEAQGNHTAAEPLYNRTFALSKKAFGPDHPAVGRSLHKLALVKSNQGKYKQAEPLFNQALAILSKHENDAPADLANCLEDFAQLLRKTNRSKEADAQLARAQRLRAYPVADSMPAAQSDASAWSGALASGASLSTNHQDSESSTVLARASDNTIMPTFSTLAEVYYNQSRYSEAEPLYKHMISIDQASLGPDHPGLADDLNNLSLLYVAQARYLEAEPLLVRALAIYEKAYGLDNVLAVKCQATLASVYQHIGQLDRAEDLYRKAASAMDRAVGVNSLDRACILNNLAYLYYSRGNYQQSENVYKQALTSLENAVGPDSKLLAADLQDYSKVLRKLNKTGEADAAESKAKAIMTRQQKP